LATVAAFVVPPLAANEYWLQAVLIPFLIYSLAAIGLNLLTGYAGQLSLGTGGFMAVGAYAAFKLTTAFPPLNIIVVFVLSGLVFLYFGSAETLAFDVTLSFLVLFMVIIGGLGSILGSFLGAAFIVLVPILLTNAPQTVGLHLPVALQKQIELMVFGGLIIFF